MIGFAIFCVQICFIQYAACQTVATPTAINNGLPSAFVPNISGLGTGANIGLVGPGISGPNMGLVGPGLPGPNMGLVGQGLPGPNIGLAGVGLPGQNIGLAGTNVGLAGAGLNGPLLAGSLPGQAFGPIGNQALGLVAGQQLGPMGIPGGIAGNPLAGYAAAFGGSGSGDVAVAGELPVAGTTAVSGQVPLSGKVQFSGNLPAAGVVTISGQCSCGCNGPYNAPYGAKPTNFNNKPYLY